MISPSCDPQGERKNGPESCFLIVHHTGNSITRDQLDRLVLI